MSHNNTFTTPLRHDSWEKTLSSAFFLADISLYFQTPSYSICNISPFFCCLDMSPTTGLMFVKFLRLIEAKFYYYFTLSLRDRRLFDFLGFLYRLKVSKSSRSFFLFKRLWCFFASYVMYNCQQLKYIFYS